MTDSEAVQCDSCGSVASAEWAYAEWYVQSGGDRLVCRSCKEGEGQ